MSVWLCVAVDLPCHSACSTQHAAHFHLTSLRAKALFAHTSSPPAAGETQRRSCQNLSRATGARHLCAVTAPESSPLNNAVLIHRPFRDLPKVIDDQLTQSKLTQDAPRRSTVPSSPCFRVVLCGCPLASNGGIGHARIEQPLRADLRQRHATVSDQ